MFNQMEIGEISYMSGNKSNTQLLNTNGPRFENSVELEMPEEEEENQLDVTATTNKLQETKTNYDEVEQQVNNHNNSLVQDNDLDNESAHTMPIKKVQKNKVGSANR